MARIPNAIGAPGEAERGNTSDGKVVSNIGSSELWVRSHIEAFGESRLSDNAIHLGSYARTGKYLLLYTFLKIPGSLREVRLVI